MPDDLDELADQASSVAVLADPVRRALYGYVVGCPEPVSREQAASALEVPLHSAKFHLDRLEDAGLLEVGFRRLSGRTGPGAGRPSKLYRRSSRQVAVSLPERRYDVVGDVLAEAVERSARDAVPVMDAVSAVAAAAGRRLVGAHDPDGDAPGRDLDAVAGVLSRHGYEPRVGDGELCLANCPFDRLAASHTGLVCGLNLALVGGLVEGLGATGLEARLDPEEGFCCVRVTGPRGRSRTARKTG